MKTEFLLITLLLLALAGLLLLALGGCTVSDTEAARLLESEGLVHAELGGPAWWGCPADLDATTRTFTAQRPVAQPDGQVRPVAVAGVICCGWPGPCTVRQW